MAKGVLVCVLLLMSSLPSLVAQEPPASRPNSERYITNAENQWAASVPTGDTKVIARILAEDFQGTDENGIPYNKDTLLRQAKMAADHFVSYRVTDLKITFHGDTATTTGVYVWEHSRQGDSDDSPRTGKTVFTHTWKLTNGRWRVVEEQMGFAPKKTDA